MFNLRRDVTWLGLASDELLPSLSTLADNISGVPVTALASHTKSKLGPNPLLVFALASESKLVLWLSVWDFVDTEPFIGGSQQTRKVSLNILNIIELGGQWVVDVNDDDLPVSLLLVE